MARVEMLKKIRMVGLGLIVIGIIFGLLLFATEPMSSTFKTYLYVGTFFIEIGSLFYFAYEVFVPEFWKGEWTPSPDQPYPPE